MIITLGILRHVFPEDTIWAFCGNELVGYSISMNFHFVIDDAVCVDEVGEHLVSVYSPADPIGHYYRWLPDKSRSFPLKYVDEKKVIEERVNFSDTEGLKTFMKKINRY